MNTPIRVLLLEDDEDLREAIFELLEESGYTVVSAGNGEEALEKFSGPPFELAIFDVKLPGMDGLEVLSDIKAQNPELLSIVITGYATEQDTIRALRLGVGDYLKKPFSMAQLLESTARLARVARQRRALDQKEQSALDLMLWSLELCLGSLDQLSQTDRLGAAHKMEEAALGAGHSPAAVRQLKCSLLYLFLSEAHEQGELTHFPSSEEVLSPGLAAGAEAVKNHQEEPDRSLLGLAVLAYRRAGDQELSSKLAANAEETGGSSSGSPGSLLSLARTLLASGRLEAARKALTEAAAFERESLEKGLAMVELCLLRHREGDAPGARELLRDSLSMVGNLGPQAAAELSLEAGLASLSIGLKDGAKLLTRTMPLLERLKLSQARAVSELALAIAGEEATPPEQLEVDRFLLRYHTWFLPGLLGYRPGGEAEEKGRRILARLCLEAPRQVSRLILSHPDESFVGDFLLRLSEWNLSGYQRLLEILATRKEWPTIQRKADALLSREQRSKLPTLRFYSLGSFELWLGAERIPEVYWRTYRSRFLLANLVSRQGRPVLQETLVEQFWPGVAPKNGRKNLSQVLSDARKALLEAGFPETVEPIVRRHDTVMINEELEWWHDLDHFESLHEKGKAALESGDRSKAYQFLREAASLLKGPYLEDCPMEWALEKRRELERTAAELYDSLGHCCYTLSLFPEAVEMAEKMLTLDPCNQRAHLLAMESHHAHGRNELAMRQFEVAEKNLKEELGLEPSTELLRAYHKAKLAL